MFVFLFKLNWRKNSVQMKGDVSHVLCFYQWRKKTKTDTNQNEAEAEDDTPIHFKYTYPCRLRIKNKIRVIFFTWTDVWIIHNERAIVQKLCVSFTHDLVPPSSCHSRALRSDGCAYRYSNTITCWRMSGHIKRILIGHSRGHIITFFFNKNRHGFSGLEFLLNIYIYMYIYL